MDETHVLQLLELLESRGVVAWVAAPDEPDAVALLLEFDGFESATALLVARGFRVATDDLPGRTRLVHPNVGAIELHPAGFDVDGNATRTFSDGAVTTVPAASFVTDTYGSGRARQVRR